MEKKVRRCYNASSTEKNADGFGNKKRNQTADKNFLEGESMDKKLKLLVVEDDQTANDAMVNEAAKHEDLIYLIGTTNNSIEAFDLIEKFKPEVVILDLELHFGGGNGISLMKQLKESKLQKPYILVTTNNISQITHAQAREYGADFIMTKIQTDYSPKTVIEFLLEIKHIIHGTVASKNTPDYLNIPEEPSEIMKKITKRINTEFDLIGISPRMKGRKYLRDGIIVVIEDPEAKIIAELAKANKKSDASVERAMQNAINYAWRTSAIEDLLKYYTARINPTRGVPTIMEFLFHYAEKIKHDL